MVCEGVVTVVGRNVAVEVIKTVVEEEAVLGFGVVTVLTVEVVVVVVVVLVVRIVIDVELGPIVDVVVDEVAVVVGCSLASKSGVAEVVVAVIGVTIEVVEDDGVGVTGSDIASCLPNMYSKTYLTTG